MGVVSTRRRWWKGPLAFRFKFAIGNDFVGKQKGTIHAMINTQSTSGFIVFLHRTRSVRVSTIKKSVRNWNERRSLFMIKLTVENRNWPDSMQTHFAAVFIRRDLNCQCRDFWAGEYQLKFRELKIWKRKFTTVYFTRTSTTSAFVDRHIKFALANLNRIVRNCYVTRSRTWHIVGGKNEGLVCQEFPSEFKHFSLHVFVNSEIKKTNNLKTQQNPGKLGELTMFNFTETFRMSYVEP